MTTTHLAQLNIARMIAPLDSPVMADFVSNLDRINALADNAPGFIWRLKDESNAATSVRIFDDDFLIVNMSVWTDIHSLKNFVYRSGHTEVLKRRKEWFSTLPQMHMALWTISAGHFPTVDEATERLVHLRNNGESDYAFTFKRLPV